MTTQRLRIVESTWYGSGTAASAARWALWPLTRAYAAVVAMRDAAYDRGMLEVTAPALPAIGVGNLTVGGTGKTPVAAWMAAELARSAPAAIVLRGYGGDEIDVHRRLNPHVEVVANADRAAAVETARARGAQVVVLDDAFQHRRLGRTADVLLLSVEQLMRPLRLLPAGPWREPLRAAARADLIVLTRKAAGRADGLRARERLAARFPGLPIAVAHLAPRSLESATGSDSRPLGDLHGATVHAIAAVGEPGVFARQLEQLGARVTLAAFRDHHAFTDAEIDRLAADTPRSALVVCTLKDAVKLGDRWPGPSRLWYVSQQLAVEEGAEDMHRLLERVLAARPGSAATSAG